MRRLLKSIVPAPVRRSLRHVQHLADQAWLRNFGTFACPVCGSGLRSFSPLPDYYRQQWETHGYDQSQTEAETINREQYSCPFCRASDRDRLYALYLRRRLAGVPTGFRLLDFAPAAPLTRHIRREHQVEYRTADLFMDGVDDRVDLTDMRIYPDNSVDAFICSHILEHIPDDLRAMRELFRILKPGGWGILMVPICLLRQEIFEDPAKATTEADRWRYFGQGDHVRIYSRQGFLSRLGSVGFRMTAIPAPEFGSDVIRRAGITPQSVLYVGEKPA